MNIHIAGSSASHLIIQHSGALATRIIYYKNPARLTGHTGAYDNFYRDKPYFIGTMAQGRVLDRSLTHQPRRNANNVEPYIFVMLFSGNVTPSHPLLHYVTLEWPLTTRLYTCAVSACLRVMGKKSRVAEMAKFYHFPIVPESRSLRRFSILVVNSCIEVNINMLTLFV